MTNELLSIENAKNFILPVGTGHPLRGDHPYRTDRTFIGRPLYLERR